MSPPVRRVAPMFLLFFWAVASALAPAGAAAATAQAADARAADAREVASSTAADTLEARVDSLMADYRGDDSPGAVVGVTRDGEVVFVKGYGMADLTHGIPITAETRFNLGSASKQFLAFALALLESRGELSLDDPVAEYLSDWPTFDEEVTLRNLLTHTSGYREAYGTLRLAGRITGRDHLPREEALEVVRRQPELEFPPGSDWQYNSTAYVILAEVLERVTGTPADRWVEENVFAPLGMEDSAIESAVGEVIPGAAYSYEDAEDGGHRAAFSNRAIFGAADVYTTVGDLAKWFRNFDTGELGGAEVQERMREPFVLTTGDTTDYALGLAIDRHRGLRRVEHGGSHAGFRAQLSYYPELGAGVVVMSNYDDVDAGGTVEAVAELAFGDRMQPEPQSPEPAEPPEPVAEEEYVAVDSSLLAKYAGRYGAESGQVFTFRHRDGALSVQGYGRLAALSDTVFRLVGTPARAIFRPGEDGTVPTATLLAPGGDTTFVRRIEEWRPTGAELEAYAGAYWSPELETRYTIRAEEGGLVIDHRWLGEAELERLERDEFSVEGFRIRFERDDGGAITGFSASTGRTRDVWFQKQE